MVNRRRRLPWVNTERGVHVARDGESTARVWKEYGVWCMEATHGAVAMSYATAGRVDQAKAMAEKWIGEVSNV